MIKNASRLTRGDLYIGRRDFWITVESTKLIADGQRVEIKGVNGWGEPVTEIRPVNETVTLPN